MKVFVTGGTGFVGSRLVPLLIEAGHEVTLLSRDPEKAIARFSGKVSALFWNAEKDLLPREVIDSAEGFIHLMGENVAGGRWTDSMKKRIWDSRILSGQNITESLKLRVRPLSVLIGASAIGFYGNAGHRSLDETSPKGTGFLADVCEGWESVLLDAPADRSVTLRIGVVLGKGGGALEKIVPIFRLGLGGRVGSGKQWMSWIHLDDLCQIIVKSLTDPKMRGVYNAVSPNPIQNAEFTEALATALDRPAIVPVPALALKLGFGEMANETVLASQKVSPTRILGAGFSFRYPDLLPAIKSVL